jgi:NAD(P)-dependent dehydrogenase (short-subunit alcohol dehydrogenase family)
MSSDVDPGRLAGKVAIITGAAGGIGRATAHRFAAAGAQLALTAADEAALAALARELAQEVLTVAADTSETDQVEAYVARVVSELGTPDVLFNNAAIEGQIAPTVGYDQATFERVLRVNVLGVWLNLARVAKAMLGRGEGGSIINAASAAGVRGLPFMSAYVASKHAVVGLTRTAAVELAASGIRVNAICPGPVDTRMMQSLERQHDTVGISPEDAHRALTANIPIGRYGRPEEIAELVLFLASGASSFITGAALPIDGGRTA